MKYFRFYILSLIFIWGRILVVNYRVIVLAMKKTCYNTVQKNRKLFNGWYWIYLAKLSNWLALS